MNLGGGMALGAPAWLVTCLRLEGNSGSEPLDARTCGGGVREAGPSTGCAV